MPDTMPNMPSSSMPKAGGAKGLIIAVVVVVLLAAVAWLIFGTGGSKPKPGQQATGPGAQGEETSEPSAVPNEVYSYVGEVTAVGNGQITVLAKKENNLLDKDTTLTVKADADTEVIRRNIPRVLPESGGAGLFTQENISISDLEVGNQVTVVSATNVRGVTNFTATRIEALNVK